MTENLPASYDLDLYTGDTFVASFRLKSGDDYVDLSSSTVTAEIRNADDTLYGSFSVETPAEEDGRVNLRLTSVQTANFRLFASNNYRWDLQVATAGAVRTWVRGNLRIHRDVTEQ